ncbi:hypothetical protein AGMMS50293_26180 [Spirochaetia bacterium]|nr:hypothetical protein AGMMS50293_26180 [Spirochaetia bacterium]
MDSVVNQTLQDIEIICVNDGSQDASVEILEEYAGRDSRITIINKENGGLSSARNAGMKHAHSEYIAFVDSDDWVELDTFERAYNAMRESGADLVCFYAQIEIENHGAENESMAQTRMYHSIKRNGLYEVSNELLLDATVTAWNKLYKRSIIEENQLIFPEGKLHEDMWFTPVYYALCEKVYYIDGYLYHYFQRSSSIIGKYGTRISKARLDKIEVACRLYHYYAGHGFLPEYRAFFSTFLFWAIEEVYLKADIRDRLHVLRYSTEQVQEMDLSLLDDSRGIFHNLKDENYTAIPCFKGTVCISDTVGKSENSRIDQMELITEADLEIKKHTALVIECNNCHGEVIGGYVKYLLDLDYYVDVLITPNLAWMKPLARLTDERLRVWVLEEAELNPFFNMREKLELYGRILITSHIVYVPPDEGWDWKERTVFEQYPALNPWRDKIILVEHHAGRLDEDFLRRDKVVMIEDFFGNPDHSIACNPHYFGDVRLTSKNSGCVKFITVGMLSSGRKNFDLLIEAVDRLAEDNIINFKIIVVGGEGQFPELPNRIKDYFDLRGRLEFPDMFSAMEEADFFLCLLDPENPAHTRYIIDGTSGSFQLIYGFAKPCLIHAAFAGKRGFNNHNSLVYDANNQFAPRMREAVEMSAENYSIMQGELKKIEASVYIQSLETLKRVCMPVTQLKNKKHRKMTGRLGEVYDIYTFAKDHALLESWRPVIKAKFESFLEEDYYRGSWAGRIRVLRKASSIAKRIEADETGPRDDLTALLETLRRRNYGRLLFLDIWKSFSCGPVRAILCRTQEGKALLLTDFLGIPGVFNITFAKPIGRFLRKWKRRFENYNPVALLRQFNRMKDQIVELDGHLNAVYQIANSNREGLNRVTEELSGTRQRVDSAHDRISQVNDWLNETNKWVENTNNRIDEANKLVDETSKWVEGHQEWLSGVQAQVNATKNQADEQHKWLDGMQNQLFETQGFVGETKLRVDSVDNRITQVNSWLNETNQRVENTNNRIDDTNKRVDSNQERLSDVQNQVTGIREQVAVVKQQVDTARNQADEQHKWLDGIQAQIDVARNQADEQHKWLDGMQKQVGDNQKGLEGIQNQVVEVHGRLEEAQNQLLAAYGQLSTTQNQLFEMQGLAGETKQRVDSADNRIAQVNDWLSETNKRVENTNNRIDEANKLVDDTNKRVDGNQELLSDVQNQVTGTLEQVAVVKQQVDTAKNQAESDHWWINSIEQQFKKHEIVNNQFITEYVTRKKAEVLANLSENNTEEKYGPFKYNKAVADTLAGIGEFYFLPNNGNFGDVVIAGAEYQFLNHLGCAYRTFDMYAEKLPENKNLCLVYGGGGLFVKYYDYHIVSDIFKSPNLEKIVILPSSFFECDELLSIFDKRFTVFCREKRSYDYCVKYKKKNKTGAAFILSDDMAFNLDLKLLKSRESENIVTNVLSMPEQFLGKLYEDYGLCMHIRANAVRAFAEKTVTLEDGRRLGYLLRSDVESVSEVDGEIRGKCVDLSSLTWTSCADAGVVKVLTAVFAEVVNTLDIVVTDRLHVGIMAAMLGKRVYLLDNSYGKLSGVYEQSIAGLPYVSLIKDVAEVRLADGEYGPVGADLSLFEHRYTFDDFFAVYFSVANLNPVVCNSIFSWGGGGDA